MSESIKLIVGLGNVGREYEFTRHNLGFIVLKKLAEEFGASFHKESGVDGLVAQGKNEYQDVLLLMPSTFVNNSGTAVRQLIQKKQLAVKDLLVVCDDMALEFGQLRLRAKGSDGGHNGLKSISAQLTTQDFPRLRLGVGAPVKKEQHRDFVLSEFTASEKKRLSPFVKEAAECCDCWLTEGTLRAMSQYNKRKEDE